MKVLVVDFRSTPDKKNYHACVAVVENKGITHLKQYVQVAEKLHLKDPSALKPTKLGALYNQKSYFSTNPINDVLVFHSTCGECEVHVFAPVPERFKTHVRDLKEIDPQHDNLGEHPCDNVISYAKKLVGRWSERYQGESLAEERHINETRYPFRRETKASEERKGVPRDPFRRETKASEERKDVTRYPFRRETKASEERKGVPRDIDRHVNYDRGAKKKSAFTD